MERRQLVKLLLNREFNEEDEEQILDLLIDEPIAIDVDKEDEKNKRKGDRIADKITNIAGSWTFILGFTLFLISWIILNLFIIKLDPYPFILLNLLLSCIAALQAPIIMMSQNREAKKDSLRSKNDYKTDLKSELILEDLHEKLEKVINKQNEIIEKITKIEEKNKKIKK